MLKTGILKSLCIGLVIGTMVVPEKAQAATETDELRHLIKIQQIQLDALKKRLDENEQKIEATAEVVEQTSETDSAKTDTRVGGYGELHYKNSNYGDELDFHRFVLFFNHKFDDNLRFFSELELEHAFNADGKPGEVELEQAYIEYDLSQNTTSRFGAFLIPVGIINETHEPTTFYGVERNPIEKNIIPTTWWEGGASINFRLAKGWSIDTAVTSGLNVPVSGSNAYLIRKGRTKVAEAPAENFAFTARVKYTGIAGLELAASYQRQDDITQGVEGVSANLFSAHVIYQHNNFMLRALFANWDINSNSAVLLGRDKQQGFYIEPSYKLNDKIGVFARYNEWNNEAGNSLVSNKRQTTLGMNYWLHPNVVVKVDYDTFSGALDGNGFNLGMGYQF